MRTYSGYEKVSVGNIPQKKLEKAIKTGKLSLSADDLKGNRVMLLHPMNAKKVREAKSKNKGITGMGIAGGEIMADIEYHDMAGGSMNGGSLWSWLKKAGKSIYNFAKDNWGLIKPVVSKIADVAVPALATAVGQPMAGVAGRQALKQLTGVGMADKMAKVREAKKNKRVNVMTAGSFLIN
jgi:hypothetical protein